MKLKVVFIALLFLLFSSISFSVIAATKSNLANEHKGAYFGMAIGTGGMQNPEFSTKYEGSFVSLNTNKFKFITRVFGGYLEPWGDFKNISWGVELGYNSYSNNKYNLSIEDDYDNISNISWTSEGYGIDMLGVFEYDFGGSNERDALVKHLSFVGKAGITYTFEKVLNVINTSGITSFGIKSEKSSKFLPKISLGLNYDINKRIAVGIFYSHAFGSEKTYSDEETTNSKKYVSSTNTVAFVLTYYF